MVANGVLGFVSFVHLEAGDLHKTLVSGQRGICSPDLG